MTNIIEKISMDYENTLAFSLGADEPGAAPSGVASSTEGA